MKKLYIPQSEIAQTLRTGAVRLHEYRMGKWIFGHRMMVGLSVNNKGLERLPFISGHTRAQHTGLRHNDEARGTNFVLEKIRMNFALFSGSFKA